MRGGIDSAAGLRAISAVLPRVEYAGGMSIHQPLAWSILIAALLTTRVALASPCSQQGACDPSCGQSCAGVELPSAIMLDGAKLCLNGLGLREATFLNVDVYLAGLYVTQRSRDGEQIANSDLPKLMRLRFVRDVTQSEMAEAISDGFERNAGGAYPKLKERIDRFTAALPRLKVGDTLTLSYRPQRGVEVSHGGKRLIEIPGRDFATVLFRIWLGSKPPNAGLRTGLLGGKCG